MFIDTGPMGPPWRETPPLLCKSCKQPILKGQPVEFIRFPPHGEGAEMSGRYHAQCAGPFATLARTLEVLGRVAL